MEWKEVLKVSLIVGVVTFFLMNASDYVVFGGGFPWSIEVYETASIVLGVFATGLILNKRLKKSDWGILIGMIITLLVPYVLGLLLDLTRLF